METIQPFRQQELSPLSQQKIEKPSSFSKEQRAVLRRVSGLLCSEYLNYYLSLHQDNFQQARTGLVERGQQIHDEIHQRYPETKFVLQALNETFSGMLDRHVIPSQILDKDDGSLSPHSLVEMKLASANWQGQATLALLALSKVKLNDFSDQTVLDAFYSALKKTSSLVEPQQEASEIIHGKTIAGIFGAVTTARILQINGFNVWLPHPTWDVLNGVDLIYAREVSEEVMPSEVMVSQVKSNRSGDNDPAFSISSAPSGLDTKQFAEWTAVENFAIKQASSQFFQDAGVDFFPKWVTLSHTGLGTSDEWRSTQDYFCDQLEGKLDDSADFDSRQEKEDI